MVLLEPIERATLLLSASNYVTHGDVRSVFLGLQEHLIQYMDNQDFSQYKMAQLIYQKLADYWPILDESSQISSLLDPRIKLSAFKDDFQINKAKDLIAGLNGYSSASASTSTTVSTNEIVNARNYFRRLRNCSNSNNNNASTSSTANVNIQGELNRYLAMPLEDQIDPLIW